RRVGAGGHARNGACGWGILPGRGPDDTGSNGDRHDHRQGRARSHAGAGEPPWSQVSKHGGAFSLGVMRPRGIPLLTSGSVSRDVGAASPRVGWKDAGGQPGKCRFQATTFYDRRVRKKRQDLTKPRGFGGDLTELNWPLIAVVHEVRAALAGTLLRGGTVRVLTFVHRAPA